MTSYFKEKPWECEAYKDFIRNEPCVVSDREAQPPRDLNVAHHEQKNAADDFGSGKIAGKVSDTELLPLAPGKHVERHSADFDFDAFYAGVNVPKEKTRLLTKFLNTRRLVKKS